MRSEQQNEAFLLELLESPADVAYGLIDCLCELAWGSLGASQEVQNVSTDFGGEYEANELPVTLPRHRSP